MYDAATGKPLGDPERLPARAGTYPASVRDAAYSPDGKRIAGLLTIGGPDTVPIVKVWDAESGKELLTLQVPKPRSDGGGGGGVGGPRLMNDRVFFADGGRRLIACEPGQLPADNKGGSGGGPALLFWEWDATPRPEPKKP